MDLIRPRLLPENRPIKSGEQHVHASYQLTEVYSEGRSVRKIAQDAAKHLSQDTNDSTHLTLPVVHYGMHDHPVTAQWKVVDLDVAKLRSLVNVSELVMDMKGG